MGKWLYQISQKLPLLPYKTVPGPAMMHQHLTTHLKLL